jgi:small subunit ribosomal protein S13
MARLFGMVIPDNHRIEYALTRIYGIGWVNAAKICKTAGVDGHTKMSQLKEDELKKIIGVVEKDYTVEGDLREELTGNIKRLKEIVSYRGMRHVRGLPARGQRTKSNSRTKKGKRKTVGALKKEVWAKLEQAKTQTAATAAKAAK